MTRVRLEAKLPKFSVPGALGAATALLAFTWLLHNTTLNC